MRLFVAIDPTEDVRAKLAEVVERLKSETQGPRWLKPDGWHLTLKFLGDAEAKNLDAIRAALALVHRAEPIELRFRGVGFFPDSQNPKVVWCGVESGGDLATFAGQIADAVEPLGFARDQRKFAPHVTLGRIVSASRTENLARAAESLKSYDFGTMRAAEFRLYQSFLKPGGAEYKVLAAFPFVKDSE